MIRKPAVRPATALAVLACLVVLTPAALPAEPFPTLAAADRVLRLEVMEDVPVREVYAAIGRAAGIQVVPDADLRRNPTISIDLGGRTVAEALNLAVSLAGHFWVPMAEDSVLVLADTPQNRRMHEPVGLRIFPLENVDPRTALTVLRSHLGVRSVALDEERGTISLRDSLAKLEAAERLLALVDRRPWEVEVVVRLLELAEAELRSRQEGAEWTRLGPGELAALLGGPGAAPLGTAVLGVVGRKEARLRVLAAGATGSEDGDVEPGPESSALELATRARVHRQSREVTLDFRVEARAKHREELVKAEVAAASRLPEGHALLLPVPPPPGTQGVLGGDAILALVLVPRIVSDGDVRPEDLQELWTGTEAHVRDFEE